MTTEFEVPSDIELSQEDLKRAEEVFMKNFLNGVKKYRNNKLSKQVALQNRVEKRRKKKKENKKFKK